METRNPSQLCLEVIPDPDSQNSPPQVYLTSRDLPDVFGVYSHQQRMCAREVPISVHQHVALSVSLPFTGMQGR